MTRNQVHDDGASMLIRFGNADVEIAKPLTGFVRGHLDGTPPTRQPRRTA